MSVYYYLKASVDDGEDGQEVKIPVKFRDFEQYEEADAYAFDMEYDALNDWVKQNLNSVWYIDDEVLTYGDITEQQAGSNYVDFSTK